VNVSIVSDIAEIDESTRGCTRTTNQWAERVTTTEAVVTRQAVRLSSCAEADPMSHLK